MTSTALATLYFCLLCRAEYHKPIRSTSTTLAFVKDSKETKRRKCVTPHPRLPHSAVDTEMWWFGILVPKKRTDFRSRPRVSHRYRKKKSTRRMTCKLKTPHRIFPKTFYFTYPSVKEPTENVWKGEAHSKKLWWWFRLSHLKQTSQIFSTSTWAGQQQLETPSRCASASALNLFSSSSAPPVFLLCLLLSLFEIQLATVTSCFCPN